MIGKRNADAVLDVLCDEFDLRLSSDLALRKAIEARRAADAAM